MQTYHILYHVKTVNVNGLNTLIIRQRMSDWIHDWTTRCLQEIHFKFKNKKRLKKMQIVTVRRVEWLYWIQ